MSFMAQQIKKKFIAPDAIDGSKLKLMEGEALRLQTPAGEVELLKKDAQGKLVSEGDEISFKGDIEAHVESVRAALQANIDSEESARIADVDSEESRAMGVESSLQSQITQEISDRIADVNEEQSRAEGVESSLQSQITQEISDRIADVNEEQSRAEGVESSLQSQITQEVSDRIADVNAEESRAMGVEDSLQSQINSEVSTRQSEVTRVEGLLSTEESARIAGDLNLQNQIDNVLSNIDPTALDSLTEIVAAFQEADGSLQGAISTLAGNSSGNIEAEQSRAEAAEASLQAQINQEISDRQADVDTEESRAMEVEGSLQSQITQEISDREAEDLLMFKKDGSRLMTGNINMGGGSVGPRTRSAINLTVMSGVLQPGVNFSSLLDNGFNKTTENLKLQKVVSGVATDIAIWSEGMWSFVNSDEVEVFSEPTTTGAFSFTTTFTGFVNFVFTEQVAAGLKIVNLANGTSSTDAANYGQVLSVAFTVTNLQTEVNNTQTGAGLSPLGAYVPDMMSNFINGATSLSNADSLLDSALSQEISDRQTAVYDEQSRAETVENYLLTLSQQETSDRIADVDAEETRAMEVEGSLQSQISQEISDRIADVDAEESRAMGVESSLQSQITQEISDRQSAISAEESARIADVDAEESRAMGVEGSLQSELDATQLGAGLASDGSYVSESQFNALSMVGVHYIMNATSLHDADKLLDANLKNTYDTLNGLINNEFQFRIDGDAAESSARAVAVQSLQSAIYSEESSRIAADQSLQSQIDNVLSNLDPAALDSLTEIVSAFQSADSSLQGAISTLASNSSGNIEAEESRAMAVEASLQSQITQEISDRIADVDAEQSRAEGVEASLQSQITQEISDRIADVDAEESRAMGVESSLQSQITQEISDRQADVDEEMSRAMGVEGSLQSQLTQEISDRQADVNEEMSRAMAVESSLQSQITQEISDRQDDVDAEESRALIVEGLLSDRLDVLEALAFEKESFTLGVNPTGITLAHSPKAKSTVMFVGRLALHEGLDYSISGNQVTFIGDFAYNSEDEIAAAEGDVVKVTYYY